MGNAKASAVFNSCRRKKPYPSRTQANTAAKALRSKIKSFTTFYECPYCKQWHITTEHQRTL